MNETGSHVESQVRQFTELFTANYGPVLAYVQRRVGADLAQDVVAETFLAAWRNVHELPPDPLPWLYRARPLRGSKPAQDPGPARQAG
jgi:DNA-directed RNA polymerase specialized sigma24 family protein